MKPDFPTVILATVIVMLIGGALLVYPLNPNEFTAECSNDGITAEIHLKSSIESDYYSVAVDLSNDAVRKLLVYYDDSYASPISTTTQENDIDHICGQLKYLGIDYKMIDAGELKTRFDDTSSAKEYAILNVTGALPCNVYAYDGSVMTVNTAQTWIEAGGIVIWYSEGPAGYYSAPLKSDFVDWETNQPLENNPFGFEFIEEKSFAKVRSEISEILSITQNICDEYSLKANTNVINLGYESEDGRYSMAFAKQGFGGSVVSGGNWTSDTSIAKIIASAVYDWKDFQTIDHESGRFKGTTTIDYSMTPEMDAVYVCMGTLTPRAGGLFLL